MAILLLGACEQFGAKPSGTFLEPIKTSLNYGSNESTCVNRRGDILANMGDKLSLWEDLFGDARSNFLFNENQTRPVSKLPEVRSPNFLDLQDSQQSIKFIWLDHSTILLSIDNKTVLINPVFSDLAALFNLMIQRFQPSAIPLDELPQVNYIAISHDHYDHLDMETIKHFIDNDVTFVVPLGVGSHLRHWGVDPSKIKELDRW